MTTFLEVNNQPAKFCKKTGLLTVNGDAVALTEMATLCAWCSNDLTPLLHAAGYKKISHGMCEACEALINDDDK